VLLVLLISNLNTNKEKGVLHMSQDRRRSAKYVLNVPTSEKKQHAAGNVSLQGEQRKIAEIRCYIY